MANKELFARGATELLVLSVLYRQDMYTYQIKYFFSYLEPNKAMTYSICQKVFSILYYTNMQRRGTLANGHKK